MYNRQQSPLNLRRHSFIVSAALSLSVFLCPQWSAAQVTLGGIVAAADVTQPVAGDCANYNSVLSSTGVSTNGQTHPGRCRSTVLIPLFDGAPLGSNMQVFRNSHPDIFNSQRTQVKGEFCVNSKIRVT